ncbi:MAG: TolC family protein [Bacteroidetes bacterium]|nr:MAG: TolC family protein [Bacteroidota bacterium]
MFRSNTLLTGKIILPAVFLLSISISAFSQNVWTLEDCVEYALDNNLDIQKQIQAVEANRVTLLQSGLSMLPNLNFNASNIWNTGQTIDQYTNTFATTTVRSNNFSVSSNITLFNGLQKFNSLKRNQIELMASRYDLDVLKNDISLAVAGYYLDILFNKEILDVAEKQLATTKEQVERVRKMVDAGAAAQGDLLNIEAQASTEELNAVDAANRLNISYLSLQQLIDLPVSRDFDIEKPALKEVAPPAELITADIIYEHALTSRPEIKSAELRVESAMKSLAIARGGQSPSLTFGGAYATGYSGASREVDLSIPPSISVSTVPYGITSTGDSVFPFLQQYSYRTKSFPDQWNDNDNVSLGFNLYIPIFNGWQVRSSITQAKIQRNIAELDLEKQKRTLQKTIEQAYADAVAALQKYTSSGQKVTAQEESFKYTEQKFDVGMVTSYDYNNSKKDLTSAQSELLQAKYDFIFKTTILDFYMGNPISITQN